MLLGVPALFLLVHLISSKGGDGGPVGEQDSWTGEEVEKVVDNHVNAEEEEEEGTGRTDGGSADDGEGSEKGEDDGEVKPRSNPLSRESALSSLSSD